MKKTLEPDFIKLNSPPTVQQGESCKLIFACGSADGGRFLGLIPQGFAALSRQEPRTKPNGRYNYFGWTGGCWPTGFTFFLVGGGVGQQVLQLFWLEGMLANRFYNCFGWRGCWPIGFTIILVGGDVGQWVQFLLLVGVFSQITLLGEHSADFRILWIPQDTIVESTMNSSDTVDTGLNYREEQGLFLLMNYCPVSTVSE